MSMMNLLLHSMMTSKVISTKFRNDSNKYFLGYFYDELDNEYNDEFNDKYNDEFIDEFNDVSEMFS